MSDETHNVTSPELSERYSKRFYMQSAFTDRLGSLIEKLSLTENIEISQIEKRTKTVESFIEKASRPGKRYMNPLTEITDLSGVRVILYYKQDLDRMANIIEREFRIDPDRSLDKSQLLDPDRFGYTSLHYVISLKSPRESLPEWKEYVDFVAEIQVRTVLQNAWAAIDHKLRYKTRHEIPKNLVRQLFRLSALMELADKEFSEVKDGIAHLEAFYAEEVAGGRLNIDLDLSSLRAYLQKKETYMPFVNAARAAGFRFDDSLDGERMLHDVKHETSILDVSRIFGLRTIAELDDSLRRNRNRAKKFFTTIKEKCSEVGYIPMTIVGDLLAFIVMFDRRAELRPQALLELGYSDEITKALIEATQLS